MKHTTTLTTCLLALACHHPEPTDEPEVDPNPRAKLVRTLPTPIRPEPAPTGADEAVVIEQLGISSPETWRFEPGGRRVAAATDSGCGIWQLGTGDFLGPAGEGDPCETWAPFETIGLEGAAENLALAHPDGRQLAVAGDRFVLSGPKPVQSVLTKGRLYRAAAFSPDGERLALLVSALGAPTSIEVWNLGSGRVERNLPLGADELGPENVLSSSSLRWNERGLVVIANFEPPACDEVADPGCGDWQGWLDFTVVNRWPELDQDPIQGMLPSYTGEQHVEALFVDPEERWVVGLLEVSQPRSGTGYSFESIPINDDDLETGLSWWGDTTDEIPTEEFAAGRVREWNDVVGSSFWEVNEYGGEYAPWTTVVWTTVSLTPRPLPDRGVDLQFGDGLLMEADGENSAWRMVMAGRETLLADLDVCPAEWQIEEAVGDGQAAPGCENDRVAGEGCTAIDASWAFDSMLAVCDDRWVQVPIDASGVVDMTKAVELARGTGEPRSEAWGGRGGLAIWTFSQGLRVWTDGKLTSTHPEIKGLHRAILDEELDLALVSDPTGLRVLDLETGELGPVLAWQLPVEAAAFSPDRSQLAVHGEGEIGVFQRSASEPVARWQTGKLAGLAFRQDGEVLYVGGARPLPELALDPSTGEQVESAQLDRVAFERIAAAELDPSWRWAIEEDGTILRTIDGLGMEVIANEGVIIETGWVSGDAGWLDGFRLRIGPSLDAPLYPLSDPEILAQLTRPNLRDEFLAGKPLPRPKVTAPKPRPEPPLVGTE